jgi:hypothetical protein
LLGPLRLLFLLFLLKASIWLGAVATLLRLGEAVRAVLANLFHWYVVLGWSSLTVLISLLGGATLVSIGVLGQVCWKVVRTDQEPPALHRFANGQR